MIAAEKYCCEIIDDITPKIIKFLDRVKCRDATGCEASEPIKIKSRFFLL